MQMEGVVMDVMLRKVNGNCKRRRTKDTVNGYWKRDDQNTITFLMCLLVIHILRLKIFF